MTREEQLEQTRRRLAQVGKEPKAAQPAPEPPSVAPEYALLTRLRGPLDFDDGDLDGSDGEDMEDCAPPIFGWPRKTA